MSESDLMFFLALGLFLIVALFGRLLSWLERK